LRIVDLTQTLSNDMPLYPGMPRPWYQQLPKFSDKPGQQCSRRPDPVRHSRRSSRIPGRYEIRSCPPEHTGWNVLLLDQR